MIHTYKDRSIGAYFVLSTDYLRDERDLENSDTRISIHWNRSDEPVMMVMDGVSMELLPNQLLTTTYLQKVRWQGGNRSLVTFAFNREFYCIKDHDNEVSCNGIIFFGTQNPPIVTLENEEVKKFSMLYEVFLDEFTTRDNIQGEMLQMLLKRLIIKITRLAKSQLITKDLVDSQIDVVRKFNALVDMHYKEKRQVSDYAELLFKSPKTLSNLFGKYNEKTPLQIIHERIVLEGKRLLLYTDLSAKEIAHHCGFDDSSSFHKLFKKVVGMTPQAFKNTSKPQVA